MLYIIKEKLLPTNKSIDLFRTPANLRRRLINVNGYNK